MKIKNIKKENRREQQWLIGNAHMNDFCIDCICAANEWQQQQQQQNNITGQKWNKA